MKLIHTIRKNKIATLIAFFISCILIFNNISFNFNFSGREHNKNLTVHFIDVGQGDAILIQVNNKNLLIDSGPSVSRNKIIKYLKKNKIHILNYVIATHPHEDHIGNMSQIINTFNVEKFYSPKVIGEDRTFEDMIYALKFNNLKVHIITDKTCDIDLGKETSLIFYSPSKKKYDNLNNYSPIIQLKFKNNSFLFTGDAEEIVEKEILTHNYNLSSDVLKAGHHGSDTSTSEDFLAAVNPSVAVICVGSFNKYNHPSKTVLSRLEDHNCKIYRTDLNSNIVMKCDGNNIKIYSN